MKNNADFVVKSALHPSLPIVEELQKVNDTLETISQKETPDVQKVELMNKPSDLAAQFFSLLKGEKGDEPSDERLQELIAPLIPEVSDGEPGKDYILTEQDKKEIASKIDVPIVEKEIETIIEKQPIVTNEIKEVAVAETAEQIVGKINSLPTDEDEYKIGAEHVRGFEGEIQRLDKSISSIPRGGGGGRGFQLYIGGTKKGLAQFINIVAGPNMTISDSIVNGLHTLTFTSTGGSGFSQLLATEIPNGLITVFTFSAAAAKPSFLVVDNVWMQATTASGTVNWTWNAGAKKATLSVPANDDIFAVV